MNNRKTCVGCSHYRTISAGNLKSEHCCHYSIDTDVLRGCPVETCDKNDHKAYRRGKRALYA